MADEPPFISARARPSVTVDVNPRTGNLMVGCETCGWWEDHPLNSQIGVLSMAADEHEYECPGDA